MTLMSRLVRPKEVFGWAKHFKHFMGKTDRSGSGPRDSGYHGEGGGGVIRVSLFMPTICASFLTCSVSRCGPAPNILNTQFMKEPSLFFMLTVFFVFFCKVNWFKGRSQPRTGPAHWCSVAGFWDRNTMVCADAMPYRGYVPATNHDLGISSLTKKGIMLF